MNDYYSRILYYSDDDKCWVALIPELAGCQADGESKEEALFNSNLIVKEWIKTSVCLGRKIPKPNGHCNYYV